MKRFLFVFFLLIFLSLFKAPLVRAEYIDNFHSEIVAHRDGTMDIDEKIIYDFGGEEKHGIYRQIPLVSRLGDLYRIIDIDINSITLDGEAVKFSRESSPKIFKVRIGDPNRLITGRHEYIISYSVKNGIGSNYEDHDEIYWNITGNEWQVPIVRASSRISTDFGVSPEKAACYTGPRGSSNKDCDIEQVSTIRNQYELGGYEGLTSVWSFPKGTFPPSTLQKNEPGTMSPETANLIFFLIAAILFIMNFVAAPFLFLWYWRKKRKKSLGKPAVNFEIPEDQKGSILRPAEAGSIDSYRVDRDDIVATLFDLAIRKYIKIEQVKKEKTLGIFGKDEDYEIVKLKPYDKGLAQFEKTLLERLFSEGDKVEMSSLQKDFYLTFKDMEKEIFSSLIGKGYYVKNPKVQMELLLAGGIMVVFFGGPLLGIVLIYLSRVLNGRTGIGDVADLRIDGLKLFLKNMKRNYEWQAKNIYTVEKMIPYAIAFGYINEFMKQLKEMYPDYHPTWYHGNSFYLVSGNMLGSMNSSFTTTAPSSSSGFSGGSSGGGGGGGGGGSW